MITLSYFGSAYDNVVETAEEYTWSELVELFSQHRQVEVKNDLGFIGGKFKEHGREAKVQGSIVGDTIPGSVGRYAENVAEMHLLCLDYDGGATIADVRAQLHGLRHLGYTSHSHLKDGVTEKFRVLIPVQTPISGEDWSRRFRNFRSLFPGVDQSAFSLGRIFYAPTTQAGENRPTFVWNEDGELFDWTQVPAEEVRVAAPRPVGSSSGTGVVLPGTLDALALFIGAGLDPVLIHAGEGKYLVRCPNENEHSAPGKSGTVIWSGVPGRRDGFYCAHSHCQGKTLWQLFPKEILEKHCERELTFQESLSKLKTLAPQLDQVNEEIGEVKPPNEVIRLPERQFSPPLSWDERKVLLHGFVGSVLGAAKKAHAVLRTPEGYGKSTVLVEDLVRRGKKVLFCCSSNAQANKKLIEFSKHGSARAWGTAALLMQDVGVKAVMGESTGFEQGGMDVPATIEAIMEKLECSIPEAMEVLEEIRARAKTSRKSEEPVLITTFATGTVMFNAEAGRLGRVIIVDDPSTSDLLQFQYEFVAGEMVQKAQRDVEKLPFGVEYPWQDKIIWTTTEQLVLEFIKLQHQGALVKDIQESLDTRRNILLHPTTLVRKALKPILPGMHQAIEEEAKKPLLFLANGVGSALNLVSTKGRNDLVGDMTIVISRPHPCEIEAVAATLQLDTIDRVLVVPQMVTDVLDQALGRAQGYREKDFDDTHALVLVEPNLEVAVKCRSRYRLVGLEGLRRKGRLHGVPIEWPMDRPLWWQLFMAYLVSWEKYVVQVPDSTGTMKFYDMFTLRKMDFDDKIAKQLERHLNRPTEFCQAMWKTTKEHIDGSGTDRRDFELALRELVLGFNKRPTYDRPDNTTRNQVLNAVNKKRKMKFVSSSGEKFMAAVDEQVPLGFDFASPRLKTKFHLDSLLFVRVGGTRMRSPGAGRKSST